MGCKMTSDQTTLEEHIKQAVAKFNAMTPEQQAAMREAQRQSWVRSILNWPKPKYNLVNGIKVYNSYEDYCND